MLSTSGLPLKIKITEDHVVFEVEYLWNGRVKKDGVSLCLNLCANVLKVSFETYQLRHAI